MTTPKKTHRKDGSFCCGNKAASKGEPRRPWSGRLPESTHDQLRALVESKRYESQADAVAAGVSALANASSEGAGLNPANTNQ